MTMNFGIDLGGTTAKLAMVDSKKRIVKESSIVTAGLPDAQDLAKKIGFTFKMMVGKTNPPKKIGVGVAGDIDVDHGVVRISPNLGWQNVPLRRLLENATKTKVIVDNDANVAAWGIYQTQVPPKIKNVLAVTLGTGVGGGLILNGGLYRGSTGSAGEVGHMVMDEHGRLCNCGLHGCLETYAGGTHIVKKVLEALSKGEQSELSPLFAKDPTLITPQVIADAALNNDSFALSVWNKVGHMLGIGLGNLIYVLNPEIIFLTGGLSQAKNLLLHPLMENLLARPFKTPIKTVKIRIAKDPAHMGVIGAALL